MTARGPRNRRVANASDRADAGPRVGGDPRGAGVQTHGPRGGPVEVSIVLPTRNRAARLSRAVESVFAQTHAAWELIVVDDAATDDTPRVIEAMVRLDSRVRALRVDDPVGAAAARNRGIAVARGRYVAFLDDDAEWFPGKLRRHLDALAAGGGEACVSYGPFIYVDATGRERRVGSPAASGPRPLDALLRGNMIDTSVVVVRRDLLERVGGFDERLPRLQDWDLWLRLASETRFAFVPEPLVRSYHSPGGISSRPESLVEACEHLAAKYADRLGRGDRAIWAATLGHTLMTGGAPGRGRVFLWRSLVEAPVSARRFVQAGLSLFGGRAYNAVVRLRAIRSDAACHGRVDPSGRWSRGRWLCRR